ncbi:MAG: 2-oxo acid dehydrogenase subunit E2, partial [Roseibacillus sp.]|nr:2-oxo acid dehydrogenase subunit E2 [Roseibacillus sp.]
TQDAAAKARADRLRLDDLQGGTFTITNLGMYSVDDFTPLLNPPQGSILGIGRIVRKPSVHGEQVVPRDRISLSLTFDHRGAAGAHVGRRLE